MTVDRKPDPAEPAKKLSEHLAYATPKRHARGQKTWTHIVPVEWIERSNMKPWRSLVHSRAFCSAYPASGWQEVADTRLSYLRDVDVCPRCKDRLSKRAGS